VSNSSFTASLKRAPTDPSACRRQRQDRIRHAACFFSSEFYRRRVRSTQALPARRSVRYRTTVPASLWQYAGELPAAFASRSLRQLFSNGSLDLACSSSCARGLQDRRGRPSPQIVAGAFRRIGGRRIADEVVIVLLLRDLAELIGEVVDGQERDAAVPSERVCGIVSPSLMQRYPRIGGGQRISAAGRPVDFARRGSG